MSYANSTDTDHTLNNAASDLGCNVFLLLALAYISAKNMKPNVL